MRGLGNIRTWACFQARGIYPSYRLAVNRLASVSIGWGDGSALRSLSGMSSGTGAVFLL